MIIKIKSFRKTQFFRSVDKVGAKRSKMENLSNKTRGKERTEQISVSSRHE